MLVSLFSEEDIGSTRVNRSGDPHERFYHLHGRCLRWLLRRDVGSDYLFSCENIVWIYTDPPFCFAQDYDYITTEENFVGNAKNFSSINPTNNILLDDDCVMVFPISASSAAARFL